jgi:hydroxymethylglutaryl-CoA synthase
LEGDKIEFIEVASESKPYAVKPTASIVAEFLDCEARAADVEFACKAGTHSLLNAINAVKGEANYALAIGTDAAQASPGDELELFVGEGGVAFVVGKTSPIALVEAHTSYTSDTPDFWRKDGELYPKHLGRFTGEPGYFEHVERAAKKLMEKQKVKPKDVDYVIFHQPNPKFPRRAAKNLGFKEEQVEPGMVVEKVGNLYSASSLLGLAKVLDEAKAEETIMVVSYGSGAGSDALLLRTTRSIERKRRNIRRSVKSWIGEEDEENLVFIDYGKYLRYKGVLEKSQLH